MSGEASRLAVLGSPIAHSLSPALHRAAYAALGVDWSYEAIEVGSAALENFVVSRGLSWRGLSLTMPLKRDIIPLLDRTSNLVDETGSANTVLFDEGSRAGFNTDVYGITESFARHDRAEVDSVLILGGGATAASAVVAAIELGAARIDVAVRAPERAATLVDIADARGVPIAVHSLAEIAHAGETWAAVISTLPGGADVDLHFAATAISGATLLDVAYHPWPSPLAARWGGIDVISGLEMLVLQALAQVRIFVTGEPHSTLPGEDVVLTAMLRAAGL